MTGAPGAPPPGGAAPAPPPGQPGQPPGGQASGPGGATAPGANRGLEAAALARLAVYAQGMATILAVLPVGSDASRDVREALNKIAKHIPPGGASPGVQMSEAQRNLMQQRQMGPQIAAMRAGQAGGGQPAPPPQPQAA
jgi:hypothetical protein